MYLRRTSGLVRRIWGTSSSSTPSVSSPFPTTGSSNIIMRGLASRLLLPQALTPQPAAVITPGQLPHRRSLSTSTQAGEAGAAAVEEMDGLEKPKPPRNSLVGVVVSDKMDKSIVVKVSRVKLFLPYMVRKRTFKKIMAHDEENQCGIGDTVRIKPSRPLSKRKAFALHEIIRKDPKLTI